MMVVLPCHGLIKKNRMSINNTDFKDTWIIGCGGHAKVIIAACQSAKIGVNGLFDGDSNLWDTSLWEIKIGPLPAAEWWKNQCGVLAIGENKARQHLSRTIFPKKWGTVIHPTAIVHHTASIGEGTYIGALAVIQPNASIGKHVIINTGAIVEHDVNIESFCHIAPQTVLSGSVSVGEGTLIGAGSAAIPGVRIGCWSTIGAGSVMIKNIDSHTIAVGVPCRVISQSTLR